MSDILARRASVSITFDGADITSEIMPFLLQLEYTDNEEDATDDLQIKLQDRDGKWINKWLSDMIQAAIDAKKTSVVTTTTAVTADDYAVGDTVQFLGGYHYVDSYTSRPTGSKCNPGPAKLTIIKPGRNHPYHVIHTDSSSRVYGWVDADEIEPLNAKTETSVSMDATGFKIKAVITQKYWNSANSSSSLDCGEFEFDAAVENGPPATLTIKATSLPFSSQIRQTKNSKAWESYHLSKIAAEMASSNGMKSSYLASSDPYYSRVEQYKQSDIDFLSVLCHNAGISLKATNGTIVLFDQADYESKSPVKTIQKGDGSYIKYKLNNGSAETEYNSCRVSYTTPSGDCIEGTVYVDDYDADSSTNQQLEISAKVTSTSEAKALAAKCLRLYNKYECTATFTFPGDTRLVAGVTVMLSGWGLWDGKYIIKSAKHTVSHNGYQTQITLRRVLGGY